MPHMRSVSMFLVVTITTGIALVWGSLVRLRVAWNPFIPGMITSISTRSGLFFCAAAMPASAVSAAVTLCPARSNAPEKIFTSVGESSMIRICAIGFPMRARRWRRSLDGRHVLPDRVQQFVAGERFGQVLLGTHDPAARLVEQAVLGGQHDHRRGTEHVVVLDQRAGLIAIQPRHHDVHEDDVGTQIGDLGQRLETVHGGQHLRALFLQQGLGGTADGLRVVDDHHLQSGEAIVVDVVVHGQGSTSSGGGETPCNMDATPQVTVTAITSDPGDPLRFVPLQTNPDALPWAKPAAVPRYIKRSLCECNDLRSASRARSSTTATDCCLCNGRSLPGSIVLISPGNPALGILPQAFGCARDAILRVA